MKNLFIFGFSLIFLAFSPLGFSYQYGPVKKGETLWRIALNTRPNPSVSVASMMHAIKSANPHAFKDHSPQSLMVGTMLTIPGNKSANALKKNTPRSIAHQSDQLQINSMRNELAESQAMISKIQRNNIELLNRMHHLQRNILELQEQVVSEAKQTQPLSVQTSK